MAQVSWTPQALRDLDAVCLFIARDAPRYAEIFAYRVFQAVDRVGEFPNSGRIVPEIGRNDIREIILQSYRIVFRVRADEVEILTIHHGARPISGLDFGHPE